MDKEYKIDIIYLKSYFTTQFKIDDFEKVHLVLYIGVKEYD